MRRRGRICCGSRNRMSVGSEAIGSGAIAAQTDGAAGGNSLFGPFGARAVLPDRWRNAYTGRSPVMECRIDRRGIDRRTVQGLDLARSIGLRRSGRSATSCGRDQAPIGWLDNRRRGAQFDRPDTQCPQGAGTDRSLKRPRADIFLTTARVLMLFGNRLG